MTEVEIHPAARRDRDFERGVRNSKIARARVNGAELRVNVGRELVELAERNHRPVGEGLRGNVRAVDRPTPGVEFESPAQPAIQILIGGAVAAVQVEAPAWPVQVRVKVRIAA